MICVYIRNINNIETIGGIFMSGKTKKQGTRRNIIKLVLVISLIAIFLLSMTSCSKVSENRDVSGFDEDVTLFPIAPDMVQRITEGLLKGELQFMKGIATITDLNIVPDAKEG